MQVELRLLASKRGYSSKGDKARGSSMIEVPDGITCGGLMELMGMGTARAMVVLVNGRHAGPEKILVQGDVIAVFPPVAGG